MARLTAQDVFGARTPEEYRAKQRSFMASHRRGVVQRTTDAKPTVVLESDGGLRFKCSCGDYPLVDPRWNLACCFNCGLVYTDLDLPKDAA